MKKIIVSGGTGLIGSELVEELNLRGYKIDIITRKLPREPYFFPKGVERYILLDDFLAGTNVNIEDYYAAFNLAGASIAESKWTEEYKKLIIESRINVTRAFADLINKANNPPKFFFSASAVGFYGDRGNTLLTEDTENGEGFLAEVCFNWEEEAKRAAEKTRMVIGRIGVVLSSKGGALEKMIMPYKMFLGGPIGNGKQWLSWIHLNDLISLFIFTLENENCNGIYNFTAPNPEIMDNFSDDIGDVMYRPSFFRVPKGLLKMMMGESSSMLLTSQRAIPQNALKQGYIFKYPDLKPALKHLLRGITINNKSK